jgi:hypothetical protein
MATKSRGFGPKLVQSLDQTKKEADSLRIGLSLYRIIAMRRRILLSLEKPFPIGHQCILRRRSAKAELHEVRGLLLDFVAQRLVSGETPTSKMVPFPVLLGGERHREQQMVRGWSYFQYPTSGTIPANLTLKIVTRPGTAWLSDTRYRQ